MRNYPDQLSNNSPEWLAFLTDMETGWDELEPHQIVSRDFASGSADEAQREAA